MTIRRPVVGTHPDDALWALTALRRALDTPAVFEVVKKVLPPPEYSLRDIMATLDSMCAVINEDNEIRHRLRRPAFDKPEVEAVPKEISAENVKTMPLRELVSDEERRRRRDMVVKVGRCLYGEAWQTPLARALSEAGDRPMTQNRIAHWLHDGVQARPVPGWIMPALRAVAEARIEELLANVAEVRELYAAEDRGEESAA